MKTITLNLSDRVFSELRTHMGIRRMSGEACGAVVTDALLVKLITAIDEELPELTLQLKEERKDDDDSV